MPTEADAPQPPVPKWPRLLHARRTQLRRHASVHLRRALTPRCTALNWTALRCVASRAPCSTAMLAADFRTETRAVIPETRTVTPDQARAPVATALHRSPSVTVATGAAGATHQPEALVYSVLPSTAPSLSTPEYRSYAQYPRHERGAVNPTSRRRSFVTPRCGASTGVSVRHTTRVRTASSPASHTWQRPRQPG